MGASGATEPSPKRRSSSTAPAGAAVFASFAIRWRRSRARHRLPSMGASGATEPLPSAGGACAPELFYRPCRGGGVCIVCDPVAALTRSPPATLDGRLRRHGTLSQAPELFYRPCRGGGVCIVCDPVAALTRSPPATLDGRLRRHGTVS